MNIGDRIRSLRKASKHTQEYVAHQLGIERSLYAQIEYGRIKPRLDIVASIVKFYGITYEWLFDGDDAMAAEDILNYNKNQKSLPPQPTPREIELEGIVKKFEHELDEMKEQNRQLLKILEKLAR